MCYKLLARVTYTLNIYSKYAVMLTHSRGVSRRCNHLKHFQHPTKISLCFLSDLTNQIAKTQDTVGLLVHNLLYSKKKKTIVAKQKFDSAFILSNISESVTISEYRILNMNENI